MTAQWYVLRTKPHKERAVYRLLTTKEFQVYFPALRVKPKNPRASKIRPYFPGYMFVHLDLAEQGDNVLRWTPGVQGLVRFGGEPALVPENLISELKKRLAELEAAGDRPEFQKGERVRIVDGPFAGYEAIFDMQFSGKDRVQVLLAFLSHYPKRVQLDTEFIEKMKQK